MGMIAQGKHQIIARRLTIGESCLLFENFLFDLLHWVSLQRRLLFSPLLLFFLPIKLQYTISSRVTQKIFFFFSLILSRCVFYCFEISEENPSGLFIRPAIATKEAHNSWILCYFLPLLSCITLMKFIRFFPISTYMFPGAAFRFSL